MDLLNHKLTIYAAEKEISAEIEGVKQSWWHSFLILMDETEGSGANGRVVQELHYNNDDDLYMEPHLLEKTRSSKWLQSLNMLPLVGGDAENMLPLWNHVLHITGLLQRQDIQFGEDFRYAAGDVNCRTLVQCVLEAIEMDTHLFRAFTASAAGLDAGCKWKIPTYSIEKAKPQQLVISETKNEILTAALT